MEQENREQANPCFLNTDAPLPATRQRDEVLPEEGVFCHELGLATGLVSHRTQHERGTGRLGPVNEAVVERLKTHVCQALDEVGNILHSIRFLYRR
jgi:hypothetical protein